MPEEKKPPRRSDKRKKKKKKIKKATASATTENTEKPQPVSLPPDTLPVPLLPPHSPGQPQGKLPKLRAASKKDGDRLSGTGRSRKSPKDSLALLTLANPTGGSTAPVRGRSAQVRESLRWEGVLEDPQAEETRLELYRANRRQRYIAHRENQVKGAQGALRLTNLKGCKGKKAWAGSEQQAAASLLHMCTD